MKDLAPLYNEVLKYLEITQRNMQFVETYRDLLSPQTEPYIDEDGLNAIEKVIDNTVLECNGLIRELGGIPVRISVQPGELLSTKVTEIYGIDQGHWILATMQHEKDDVMPLRSNTAELRNQYLATFAQENDAA